MREEKLKALRKEQPIGLFLGANDVTEEELEQAAVNAERVDRTQWCECDLDPMEAGRVGTIEIHTQAATAGLAWTA